MAHQTRPCIGINAEYGPAGKVNSAFIRVNAGYFDNVAAAGGLPVVVPPLGKEVDLDAWLDRLDGFVLTGSVFDLDPRRLSMPPHSSVQPLPERRHDSDRLLIRRILERRLRRHYMCASGGGHAARHAAPRPDGRAAPSYRVNRAEHAHGRDLRCR